MMTSYDEAKLKALKYSRNLHQVFARYLLGLITWSEFIHECQEREKAYEKEVEK